MNTAKTGRLADKIGDSAQRMQSYARDAAHAADKQDFFDGPTNMFRRENASKTDSQLGNAVKRMKAELEELASLVEELEVAK